MFFEPFTTKGFKEDSSLTNLLSAARAVETADAQAGAMESSSILKVSKQSKSSEERVDKQSANKNKQKEQNDGGKKECLNCGG